MAVGHDIFVSYAHGDTRAHVDAPALRKWTRQLIESLKEDLALGGRQLDVWYDYELQGNLPLTPTLKAELESSRLLIVVMTPAYLASSWCQQELSWFEQQVKRRGGVTGDVFVVDAWPTDRAKWPPFLRDPSGETLVGYPFHDGRPDHVDPSVRPHGWQPPRPDDSAYYDALAKLAGSIARRTDARQTVRRETGERHTRTGQRIYLAWSTDDVAERRQELRDALRERGFVVLPDPEPTAPGDLVLRLEGDLRACGAFIQLLGMHGGSWQVDAAGPVAWQRARAHAAGIPVLAWRNQKIPLEVIEDEGYRAYVEQWAPSDFASADELAGQVANTVTSSIPAISSVDDGPPAAYPSARAEAEPLRLELLSALLGPDLIVIPALSDAGEDVTEVERARQARRDSYVMCKALLLLRADGSPWIDQEILKFLTKDRVHLRRQRHHDLACAIVDRGSGGSTALARRMGIEVFPWTDAASVEAIRSWLKGSKAELSTAAE